VRHKTAGLVAGKEQPGSALNFIWASRGPVGTIVSNPTKMIVLRSGNASAGPMAGGATQHRRRLSAGSRRTLSVSD